MKAAFYFPPDSSAVKDLQLLLEAGDYGISLAWFSGTLPSLNSVAQYYFEGGDYESFFRAVLKSTEPYIADIKRTTICYDFKASLLVPAAFHNEDKIEEQLALLYGSTGDDVCHHDLVSSAAIYNYYSCEKNIEAVCFEKFWDATIFHSTSLQLEYLNGSVDLLYCVFYRNTLKLLLFAGGKLQVVNHLDYAKPEDATYHLLNVCEQYGAAPSAVQLKLSGLIDERSNLYDSLSKYFLNLEFDGTPGQTTKFDEQAGLPAHYFGHLTMMATCV